MNAPTARVQSLEELYMAHSKTVYWAAYQNLSDRELSADVVQSVFLNAYRHYDKLEKMAAEQVRAWLYRCAVNASIDTLRRNKRLVVSEDAGVNEIDPSKTPPEALIDNERSQAVREALSSLPKKYKEPLTLYYFAQMDYKQISALLKINEGTLKSRMSRGRALMQKALLKGGVLSV